MNDNVPGRSGSPSPPSNQEGPNDAPPQLPEGWLAQWEGQSRKYYYVQRATGHSQWEIPTQAALSVPTPDPTPQHSTGPFPIPAEVNTVKDSNAGAYEGADRSLLGDLAMNALGGGRKPQKQSGFGGLASSFLGGQGSHGQSSGGGGGGSGGGLAGQLVGSLLGGNKPQHQQQSAASGSSASHSSGGIMGVASGLLGGHHGSNQSNNFGYSSSGQSPNSAYSGHAPPAAYQPSSQISNPYGPSSGEYHPLGQPQKPSNTGNNHGPGGVSQYGQSSQTVPGISPYGQQGSFQQGNYGQHEPSFSSGNGGHYGGISTPAASYGQQAPYDQTSQSSYNPTFQNGSGNQYSSPPNSSSYGSQIPPYPQSHQAAPQHNPSYPQQAQQGAYDPYRPPPPMSSHPNQQSNLGGYPGQQSYGTSGGTGSQAYGQPPQHGYGESYDNYGAPPAPGWRG